MIVRKLRLQRGWSQDQLAEMSGLNVRTVQRIERGRAASLESLKSLAAVFETDVTDLQAEKDMNNPNQLSYEEQRAMEYVRELKGFYMNLISFVIVMPFLYWLNLETSDYPWFWWVVFGWGLGLVLHGVSLMEWGSLFGPEWERRQIEKRLGRKL